jgi:hypothetical protein
MFIVTCLRAGPAASSLQKAQNKPTTSRQQADKAGLSQQSEMGGAGWERIVTWST